MKPFMKLQLTAMAAALALASTALFACSSDNANPSPNPGVFDGGRDVAAPGHDGGTQHSGSGTGATSSSGSEATSGSGTGAIPDGSVHPTDARPIVDVGLPDVGACKSDATTCNSCYTPAQNPLNGCSPATVNCIPFDNTRVPAGAP